MSTETVKLTMLSLNCSLISIAVFLEHQRITVGRVSEWYRFVQKQHSRGDHRKICSENMQQFFRRTPMPKLLSNFIEIEQRLGFLL